ncbi:MAG: Undecaprenyl-phosphate galactose phosphotransferase [Candidatus Levybacteria bacterium GW2011_GWC1_40_19]|nr:MAG: Undecaprenyl-phosphate galactose phosphotransferase [Candidatus Levybacteria bacterium GW2011_GWA2_36_13]KKR17821.1 MAG: Undecaprenyl-phosphate galactose phosphotransferase [Candidatus Levybacteria bacterium GW2011_GWA1_39_32]KKR51556.1 MAG: Undecaprenyl-phosphate galactose phosphotransferase [Candidatus Levybacteria bacterium GW2011_GWC1_40_19]KKS02265.1 MAG: Undecaprenyl-phosphate galactose phosphotransferase [Candidatus Levybacteria bacterium GW2011_GWB1_41_21]OGH20828.1 MAG: hypothe
MPYVEIKKSRAYEWIKRILDISLSAFLLLLFLPIVLCVAIAIKIDSKGPILADTPERVGKNGSLFKMYKFRSMVENAHEILRENPKFATLYSEYKRGSYKLKDDPRITWMGHFIRKHSLDEVPQLLNILKGEMSLVGPRAYYPDELREQQKKYPNTRDAVKIVLSVRPGLTGYWQVSGRSEINFDKRIEMDATYVRKRSILYDLLIILKTPWAMISGKGAL